MRFLLAVMVCLFACSQVFAQEIVKYPSTDPNGNAIEVEAVLNSPKMPVPEGGKFPAVVLLHTVGGWSYGVTERWAKSLSDAGIMTLEPRMFRDRAAVPAVSVKLLPMVYDALLYLSERKDVDSARIGLAGFSYGGLLTLHSAAAWAAKAYAKRPELRFAAYAPFYPSCGLFSLFAKGQRKTPGIPSDALTAWTGAPVKIFAGGRDDYDDRNPKACEEFVALIPATYRSSFSVQLYPEATHGWDHQQSATFFDRNACNGRGCMNTNTFNEEITKKSTEDLLAFLSKPLALKQ